MDQTKRRWKNDDDDGGCPPSMSHLSKIAPLDRVLLSITRQLTALAETNGIFVLEVSTIIIVV